MLYNTDDDDKPPAKQTDDDIVKEANERWQACTDWQGISDDRARSDTKFANGDSRNNYQWPDKTVEEREKRDMPCLTINNTRTHNDIIINAMSKNGFGIKIRPTAGKASYQSAKVMQNIIRGIQYHSKWSAQRRKIAEQQVDGGIGYCLIEARYVSNRSRNQDIYLKASRDPTGVYLDPWITEVDGSDANFGFVFERVPRKEFNRKYPDWRNKVGTSPLASGMEAWLSDKEVMVCRYYRKNKKPDRYVWYKQGEGAEEVEKLASEIIKESGRDIYNALMDDIEQGRIEGGSRKVFDDKVQWFLIAGDKIIEKGDWAGKYIPICRCVGRELVIDATLDRKGHTRPLIDAQRMLNYSNSALVEGVASAMKAQWLAPIRAIEGQDEMWKKGNLNNHPVLFWNDVDEEAAEGSPTKQIPPPQRIEPAQISPGWLAIAQSAERHQMMISGQFQSQMGEEDQQSAASGKAINERKEQGDTATYHFPEHMNDMDRFIGVQLLDLIPKIYDNKRAMHVMDDAGNKHWIMIDPNQADVVQELQHEKEDEEAIKLAFNPSIGEYECVSDPGPDFATQRQESSNAIGQILAANKELVGLIGDLYFKFSDIQGADEIMERLQKEIKATKPYLFDKNMDPQLAAALEQNKNLITLNTELMTKLTDEKIKVRGRDERRDIEAFKADTDRLKATVDAIAKIALTPQQQEQMRHELESGFHQHVYSMIQQANEPTVQNQNGAAS